MIKTGPRDHEEQENVRRERHQHSSGGGGYIRDWGLGHLRDPSQVWVWTQKLRVRRGLDQADF